LRNPKEDFGSRILSYVRSVTLTVARGAEHTPHRFTHINSRLRYL